MEIILTANYELSQENEMEIIYNETEEELNKLLIQIQKELFDNRHEPQHCKLLEAQRNAIMFMKNNRKV